MPETLVRGQAITDLARPLEKAPAAVGDTEGHMDPLEPVPAALPGAYVRRRLTGNNEIGVLIFGPRGLACCPSTTGGDVFEPADPSLSEAQLEVCVSLLQRWYEHHLLTASRQMGEAVRAYG